MGLVVMWEHGAVWLRMLILLRLYFTFHVSMHDSSSPQRSTLVTRYSICHPLYHSDDDPIWGEFSNPFGMLSTLAYENNQHRAVSSMAALHYRHRLPIRHATHSTRCDGTNFTRDPPLGTL